MLSGWSRQTPPAQPFESQDNPGTPALTHTNGTAGNLVILTRSTPGQASRISNVERGMLAEFAAGAGLRPKWKTYRTTAELTGYLNSIQGDLIITGRDQHEQDEPLAFTYPWGVASQQVVARSDVVGIHGIDDLASRSVALKRSSPVWLELSALAAANPGMSLETVPEQLDARTILARVSAGHYELAVLDNFTLEQNLPDYHGLEVVFRLGQEQVLSWAVRSGNGDLHAALKQYLYKNHLKLNVSRIYREDLPDLQKRKVLRLITYAGPVNYYQKNGRLRGFEYEWLERFARGRGMRLGVVIATSHEEMAEMLVQGRGDVIAAFLPPDSFPETAGLVYTRHYGYAAPLVVGRTLDYPLLDRRDLAGRRVVLPAESPYRGLLRQLQDSGVRVELVDADPGLNTYATLSGIAAGEYDLTVIGSQQVNAEFAGRSNLRSHFALGEPAPYSLVVRSDSTALRAALNEYIDAEYRKGFYQTLAAKYIEKPAPGRFQPAVAERLSPYDEKVRAYAEEYGFDWRLIIAQMYQESHFNPAAASSAGAVGLMQLAPGTAELMGVKDLQDPDSSIAGGIKYMAYLRDRFEDDLLLEERTWFTLAAYNAGYSRVQRARRLTAEMGLDQNKWFDNVEQGMLKLSRPYRKDGELIRDCSCGQTAYYIREIRTLYNNYVRLSRVGRYAASEPQGMGKGQSKEG